MLPLRITLLVVFLVMQACAPKIPERWATDPAPIVPASYFPDGAAPITEKAAIDFYFGDRPLEPIEGLWSYGDSSFLVAIIKNDTGVHEQYEYVGITVGYGLRGWQPGQVKLLLESSADKGVYTGANYGPMHDIYYSPYILETPDVLKTTIYDRGLLSAAPAMLVREYPRKKSGASQPRNQSQASGTCFIASPDGRVITSHHVINGATEITVQLANGDEFVATVVKQSAAVDIAVLELDVSTPNYLSLTSDKGIYLGQEVFTIGYPTTSILGKSAKYTNGTISGLTGVQGDATYMQISVPVQPGNSGGPVVEYKGGVVGVIAATARIESFYAATGALPQNVNWAVKSEFVSPLIGAIPRRPPAQSRKQAIERVEQAVCQVTANHER